MIHFTLVAICVLFWVGVFFAAPRFWLGLLGCLVGLAVLLGGGAFVWERVADYRSERGRAAQHAAQLAWDDQERVAQLDRAGRFANEENLPARVVAISVRSGIAEQPEILDSPTLAQCRAELAVALNDAEAQNPKLRRVDDIIYFDANHYRRITCEPKVVQR
jgi:hypothetical protein